jgi:hypothetical protein
MLLILSALLIVSLIAEVTKTNWFPYPSAWLKALGLAVPTWIGATTVFTLEIWHFIFLFVLAVVKRAPSDALTGFLLFATGALGVSLVWYLLLVSLYSLLVRSLWSELPQFLLWIKPPKQKRDILFGWAVSTLAVLVGAAPFLLSAFYSSRLIIETIELRGITIEEAVGKMFVGWYVTAAFLYQIKSVFRFKRLRRKV